MHERRRELDHLVASINSRVERAIRNWSGKDERVKQALQLVDQKRILYLAQLIGELGGSDQVVAFELAVIEYAAFVGLQYLFPSADSAWIKRIGSRVTQMTTTYRN